MATKTISVDMEAYRRLAKARRNGESFSEIIKRTVPAPFELDQWLKSVRAGGISDETAEANPAPRHQSAAAFIAEILSVAVLDTTILVDLMRKRPGSHARQAADAVRALVARGETLMTTRFNAAELYVGSEMSSDPDGEAARVDAALAPIRILDFDDAAARAYGRIEASLRSAGRPVGDMDALIASVALSNGQSLITRNPRHFQGIPGLVVHAVG